MLKLIKGINPFPVLNTGSVVTIGNFDGVHAGHRALLLQLKEKAQSLNVPAVVILFEPQPLEFFTPEAAPPRLSSLREKCEQLDKVGIDYVLCLRFNAVFANMSPDEFMATVIFKMLQAKYLLVGEDFCFGRNRSGNIDSLSTFCDSTHCQLAIFSSFTLKNERISSTGIRLLLSQARFKEVAACLGRPYMICGRVIRGQGLGRTLGIPTANIARAQSIAFPFSGVFCVKARRETGEWLYGVANVGLRPTVSGHQKRLEIHFIDASCELYGETLSVYFLHKLRDEIKFDSVNALVVQIHQDIAAAKAYELTSDCELI